MDTIVNAALDIALIGLIIYVAIIGIVASRRIDGIINKLDTILSNIKPNTKQNKNENNESLQDTDWN